MHEFQSAFRSAHTGSTAIRHTIVNVSGAYEIV